MKAEREARLGALKGASAESVQQLSSLLTLVLAVKPQTSVLPWKTNCTAISREIRKQMMRINNSLKRKGKEDGRVIINFKSSLFFKTL